MSPGLKPLGGARDCAGNCNCNCKCNGFVVGKGLGGLAGAECLAGPSTAPFAQCANGCGQDDTVWVWLRADNSSCSCNINCGYGSGTAKLLRGLGAFQFYDAAYGFGVYGDGF